METSCSTTLCSSVTKELFEDSSSDEGARLQVVPGYLKRQDRIYWYINIEELIKDGVEGWDEG